MNPFGNTARQDKEIELWRQYKKGDQQALEELMRSLRPLIKKLTMELTGNLPPSSIKAKVNSDGSGNATISIFPAITTSGAYQTVSGSPANGAAISVKGSASTSYAQNLAFVKDAFGLVTVPLELYDGVDFKARQEYKGISMRIIRAYDVNNDVAPCRVDILYGVSAYYPELAVRLTN